MAINRINSLKFKWYSHINSTKFKLKFIYSQSSLIGKER